jgi:hypothetical protein
LDGIETKEEEIWHDLEELDSNNKNMKILATNKVECFANNERGTSYAFFNIKHQLLNGTNQLGYVHE